MSKRTAFVLIILLFLSLSGCQTPTVISPNRTENTSVPANSVGSLTVWMLDVGQGDCLLIKSPSGKFLLVDGGPGEVAIATLNDLKGLGVEKIDTLVVSHGHEDHVGALAAILKQIPVRRAILPPAAANTRAYEQMLLALKASKALVERLPAGTTFVLDDNVKIDIIGPLKPNYEELNDGSLVLRVAWGKTSFLLTGDITSLAEDDLLEQGEIQPTTVLKVAHHGSNASTSEQWLKQLQPSLALISVGAGNDYGHPGAAAGQRLRAAGVRVLRTDQVGTIRLQSDGVQVQVYYDQPSVEDKSTTAMPLIGNRISRVYHRSDCNHLPKLGNQISFPDREGAIVAGYHPCNRCFPPGNTEE